MRDLDLLDAEAVGFDPMDLLQALPGVLKGTGEALKAAPRPAALPAAPAPARAPARPVAPAAVPAPAAARPFLPEPGALVWWQLGAGTLLGALLVLLLKR